MKTTDGKEYFGIGLDLTEFNRDAQSAQMQFRRIGDTAVSEGNRMDNALRKVGVTLGITFTAAKAVQFAADIATVRGEFQKLEIAFETMLGSKAKADALMAQMVHTAAITPFSLQDVAGGAKQLLAYGTAAEEVNHTLTKLGDIAAGLSIPLNDLIYLYGTTMTQGRMFTMDLRQFMGRGVPLADELSKQFGVAKSEVADLVSAGKVGAEEFNKAIMSLADGKFANLMEKQSKSITGQVSNLKDAVQVMMNDIGESSDGAINAALSGAGYLVEHYQAIGEIIGTLVVAYGSYKAAVIATSAMQQLAVEQAYAAEMAALQSILPAKQAVANADVLAAIDKGLLTKAQGENIIATRAEIAAKIDSLRVTHANIETDRLSAWESHKAALQKASASKKLVAQRETELLVAKASGDQTKIELAEKSLLEAQEQRHTTVKARKLTADQLAIATSREKAAAVELENAATAQNTAYTTANTGGTAVNVTWKNFLTKASIQATLAQLKHNMAIMANPYVIAAAAVAGLAYGIYRLITAETAAETAQNRHNKALEEAKERKESLLSTAKSLAGDITDETKTIYQQVEAWKELQKAMPEQFGKMTFSEFKAMKPEDRDKLISKGAEKQDNDNFLKQIEETEKRITNLKKEINEAYKLPNSGALIAQLEKKLSIEENGLRLLGEEKKKRAEIAEQARFEALPLKDKVTELEKQLTLYEQQRAEIEKQIPEHYRNADAMQALSGKQFEVKDGIVQLNAEWGKFDSQTWMNISGVNFLQGKINETKGMLDELTEGENDYFTSKKKAGEVWKTAQKALEDIKKKGGSVSDYTKAVETEKTAKETFEKLGGITTLPKKSGQAGKTPKDYTDQLEQQRTAIERANKDLEFQVTQSRIDAAKDGLDKTLAQNALNFEREKEDLKRQGEERLKQIQENEKLIWESKGKKGKLNLTAQLPEADKVNFANLLDDAKTKQTNADLKATEAHYGEMLDKYKDFARRRLDIEKEYNKSLAEIELLERNKRTTSAEGDRMRKVAEKIKKEAQKALRNDEFNDLVDNSDFFKRLFFDAEKLSKKTTQALIADAQKLFDYLTRVSEVKPEFITEEQADLIRSTPGALADISDVIDNIGAKTDKRKHIFGGIIDGINALAAAQKKLDAAQKTTDGKVKEKLTQQGETLKKTGLENIISGAGDAVIAIDVLIEQMQRLAQATGDDRFIEYAETMSSIKRNIGQAEKGAAIGGQIGGGLGAGIGATAAGLTDWAMQLIEAKAKERAAVAEHDKAMRDYAQTLEMVRLKKQMMNRETSAFTANTFEREINLYNAAAEALGKYNKAISARGKLLEDMMRDSGLDVTKIPAEIANRVNALGTDLETMSVKISKKKSETLKTLAPEIFKDGGFDVDAAKAFLETNKNLSEEQRRQIQNVIDLREAYDEAMKELRAHIEKVFGALDDDLANAIVNSVKSGADAWEEFGKSGSKVIEELGKKLMMQLFLKKKFDKLSKDLEDSYKLGDAKAIADKQLELLDEFFDNIGGDVTAAKKFYKDWADRAKERGFDLTDRQGQGAASYGAYEKITQDQASGIDGRLTGIQMSGIERNTLLGSIDKRVFDITVNFSEMKNIAIDSWGELVAIRKNTALLNETNELLRKVQKGTDRI